LDAGSPARVQLALRYLRCRTFLDAVLASPQARGVKGLKAGKRGRAWLAARLKVERQGTGYLVRVWLRGCQRGEALVVLRAALALVAREAAPEPAGAGAQADGVLLVRVELDLSGGHATQEARDRMELEFRPLLLKRRPALTPGWR